ncbi:uncharacterized protein LOC127726806 [Mytilus californianus]|uniref:uncharacterized protein LOC127726806 n=1 Tax=Mytilus californianus TaxID=6549 RepID=UPI0022453C35|nr:uncharacterized protein LOC127726806 [Mytilus californianus]
MKILNGGYRFLWQKKILIFSWSHTQLLCYALLKILLKEIIQKIDILKDLLCSYFIKTLMFWISEESDPSIWRPDNIIPCFMACLQKLLYCIEYSTLLHYFIPETNLFYSRFNTRNKEKLINLLKNSYHRGIQFFSSSESLNDFSMFSCGVTKSFDWNSKLVEEIIELFPLNNDRGHIRRLMYNFLHHSKSRLGKSIFSLFLSNAHQFVSQRSDAHHRSNNKQHYYEYTHGLSHLLVGLNSDALSGWLVLASFFNVYKNYRAALAVINHALSKCTDETITLSNDHTLITDFSFNDKTKEYVTKLIGTDNYIKAVKHLSILMLRIIIASNNREQTFASSVQSNDYLIKAKCDLLHRITGDTHPVDTHPVDTIVLAPFVVNLNFSVFVCFLDLSSSLIGEI